MKPLRILITNHSMAERRGPAMYVRDLATNLFRRGHQPVVYAPESGEVADELREATIPVTDNLKTITAAPDVIIGNAHPDAIAALLTFPAVPGVFICHAWEDWHADPPKFPRLRRYVAVDETCRDWLVSQKGIPEERVRLIYHAVDLDRFAPRDPLPSRPARAVVFSNTISEATGLGIIREACRRAGIAFDVIGPAAGAFTAKPEEALGKYDLVFGKGRCAIEAMAVGCSVILCDGGKLGGIVTSQNWPDLRRVNFGRRAIRHKLDVEHVTAEIAKFDRQDARDVSRSVRSVASLDDASASLLELARDAISENSRVGSPGPEVEMRAAAEYLCAMELFRENVGLRHVLSLKDAEIATLRDAAPAAPPANNELARLQHELAASQGREANLQKDLQAIYDSPAARAVLKLSGLRNSAPR